MVWSICKCTGSSLEKAPAKLLHYTSSQHMIYLTTIKPHALNNLFFYWFIFQLIWWLVRFFSYFWKFLLESDFCLPVYEKEFLIRDLLIQILIFCKPLTQTKKNIIRLTIILHLLILPENLLKWIISKELLKTLIQIFSQLIPWHEQWKW